jgi:tripeptide aminopeptidase
MWGSAGDTILGADNKAAVAVLLEAARRWTAEGSAPLGIELLFTCAEEDALAGSKAFDARRLRSDLGFVYDQASPIGGIVVASPTTYRLQATFHGRAAHAGLRPEDGRSAILAAARAITHLPHGRIDPETTANVGAIEGGAPGTNIVPERCSFRAEARSLDPARVEEVVARMVDAVHDAANEPACQADVDLAVEQVFRGYRHGARASGVLAAEEALARCGHTPERITSGGGTDANALETQGVHVVCLANGTLRNHEPTEQVAQAALEEMLDVTHALAGVLSGA